MVSQALRLIFPLFISFLFHIRIDPLCRQSRLPIRDISIDSGEIGNLDLGKGGHSNRMCKGLGLGPPDVKRQTCKIRSVCKKFGGDLKWLVGSNRPPTIIKTAWSLIFSQPSRVG